jgi:hypothetical protein
MGLTEADRRVPRNDIKFARPQTLEKTLELKTECAHKPQ